jgi:hypothetical protein
MFNVQQELEFIDLDNVPILIFEGLHLITDGDHHSKGLSPLAQ